MDGSFGRSFLLFHSAILFLLSLINLTIAQPEYLASYCTDTAGNYTANSIYRANLNTLRSYMSSNATLHNGFYNSTTGQDSDKVYGIYICRIGISSDMCRDCITTSSQRIIEQCPNQKEAIIWYLECTLRYSNRSIFGTMEDGPRRMWANPRVVPDEVKTDFNRALGNLMNGLVVRAVSAGSSDLMFATGDQNYTSAQRVWGLVQCTPDISRRDCRRCLQASVSDLPNCCEGQIGGGVNSPSCSLRYWPGSFYDLTAVTPAPPPPPVTLLPAPPTNTTITGRKEGISSRIITSIFAPTVSILLLLSIILFFLKRRTSKKQIDGTFSGDVDMLSSLEHFQFDFGTIRASTNDFSDANKFGEGGFGAVYKGVLSDGKEIAVKRLSKNSGQGDVEFKNEVVLLAKLYHKNLVRLLGFCLERKEKLLIYEFMPNGSLDNFIFDPAKRAQLDWERRWKIIGGIIRGLLYLHEDSQHKIIHRDLKASNILLDQDMNPKISDFGMAKLFAVDYTHTNKVAGTFGYMAPEYAQGGKFSVKSDVFSFGVLLLEIVSGKKMNSSNDSEGPDNLISNAWRKWREGIGLELMDPILRECCSRSEVMRCIHIGLLCVQENADKRPTMASVVLMLDTDSFTLPLPSQPAFLPYSKRDTNGFLGEFNLQGNALDRFTNQSVALSVNEASISELCPR